MTGGVSGARDGCVRSCLPRSFFERDPRVCARELIGCALRWDGCEGVIVETEAYSAVGDPACHTFFRKGAREFVAAHPAGTAYVYLNYGVHWLLNVLVRAAEEAGFVLIRAVEPTLGLDAMRLRRGCADPRAWCSGPGKLTAAFGIRGEAHGTDLCADPGRGFGPGAGRVRVETCKRIGITKAAELPWRFLAAGSPFVSRGKRVRD